MKNRIGVITAVYSSVKTKASRKLASWNARV
jgi:hypothetical protein